MKEKVILEKVSNYLKKTGYNIDVKDLSYSGVREKSPLFEGNGTKPMHIVNFSIDAIKGNPLTNNIYTVTVDAKTDKLEYIIGKNIFNKINE